MTSKMQGSFFLSTGCFGRNSIVVMIILLTFLLADCSSLVPVGFWKGYNKDLIVKQDSDQGPWGGSRWIYWISSYPGTFSEDEVRVFASDHGWDFIERIEVSKSTMSKWTGTENQAVFPLFFEKYDQKNRDTFPRYIFTDSIILQFDSGWVVEAPGSNDISTAYGYVQLSKGGHSMMVYHLWGNTSSVSKDLKLPAIIQMYN